MDIRKYITERLDAGDNMETILNGIADVANEMSAEMAQNSVKASRAQEVVEHLILADRGLKEIGVVLYKINKSVLIF